MAATSKHPGKTKKLSIIELTALNASLVDCPGYGYASNVPLKAKQQWRKFMQKYLLDS